MNTYTKFCPNVFVAKCDEKQEKGNLIIIETKYGKEIENVIHNFLGSTKDGFFLYSVTRTDGTNSQTRAEAKAEKLEGYAVNAEKRSSAYYQASNEGRDFLSLGEPIKIGHHSERRHRKLIERNWARMGKSIAESEKAKDYENRAEYWKDKANKIDLSMPESLNFFEFELEKAKNHHLLLKNDPAKRSHSMSLQYANKAVKDLTEKVDTAIRLWGDEEEIALLNAEKKEKAESKISSKKRGIVEEHLGFFAFNNDQFKEGYNKIKQEIDEGEKVVHVGGGLYIPKSKVDSFMMQYRK
tara:strand:+ start:24004 stop:24894 length:891 start_codon:yes stop_codon:yes gene_type:complete